MYDLTVNFPVAPDVAMPEPLQTIFFWITLFGALTMLCVGIVMARKYRSMVPVLMVIAGFAAIPLESLVGFLGHVTHPPEGQIMLYYAMERAIPWHMGFAYMAGFSAMYLALYPRIVSGTMTHKYAWTACAVSVCLYILVEIYPVSAGLWVYYDHQPLWLWKGMAPLTWSFMNTACEITGAALMCLLLPYLRGVKQLLIVLLAPIGALMGHLGSGWAMYCIINSSAAGNWWVLQASGLVTVGCALTIMWISVVLLNQNKSAIT